jgi:tetratricopeptide (TPR) repeat protein
MIGERGSPNSPMTDSNAATMSSAIGDTLRRARELLNQREIIGAQRLYRGVLSIAPDNVEALHLLGVAYLQAGDARQAEPLIVRSLQLGLRQAWNLTNHGAVLVALGRHQDALGVLDRALRLDAKHFPALTARGNALLGLGRYLDAQAAYEQALGIAPGLIEAWLNRGKVLRALNRPADALISFDRALQIEPNGVEAYTQRGHALRDLGRLDGALRCYRLALVIRPKAPDLLSLCGVLLTELGREAEALGCLDEALALRPDDDEILYQSCVALDLLRRYEELLIRSDRLLRSDSNHSTAWLARGNALLGLHRHAEAVKAYDNALIHAPGLTDALRNKAAALRLLGRYADALDNYDRALVATGQNAELLYSRAVALQQLGRYDDALACYAAVVAMPAETAQNFYTRGVVLQQLRREEEALECYRQASTTDPNLSAARLSEAFCRLSMGDFAQGWGQHESRWLVNEIRMRRRHADRPFWLGAEPVVGKTILLHAEQGYGDTLQFCRYASLVEARGATVVLEVPAALKTLLGSLRGVSRIVSEGDPTPAFDLQCPLMSLPLAFGTNLDTIPATTPYLRTDPALRRAWRQRLDEIDRGGRLRVGLTWSGNPRHNNDESRSIPLAGLAPLYGLDATFVSLQPAVRERDVAALTQSGIIDFGSELIDFADSAALVDVLDLVISVDTSVVHLAGALGRPFWVLLPHVPDWRWLLDRADSPWYAGACLFRQGKPGDWLALIGQVTQALTEWIAEQRRRPL